MPNLWGKNCLNRYSNIALSYGLKNRFYHCMQQYSSLILTHIYSLLLYSRFVLIFSNTGNLYILINNSSEVGKTLLLRLDEISLVYLKHNKNPNKPHITPTVEFYVLIWFNCIYITYIYKISIFFFFCLGFKLGLSLSPYITYLKTKLVWLILSGNFKKSVFG